MCDWLIFVVRQITQALFTCATFLQSDSHFHRGQTKRCDRGVRRRPPGRWSELKAWKCAASSYVPETAEEEAVHHYANSTPEQQRAVTMDAAPNQDEPGLCCRRNQIRTGSEPDPLLSDCSGCDSDCVCEQTEGHHAQQGVRVKVRDS